MRRRKSLLPKIQRLLEKIYMIKIAIWGLAFKPETDDVRESPALTIIKQLYDRDVKVIAFDPIAAENMKKEVSNLETVDDMYEAIKDADCLVITTAWKMFKETDLDKVKSLLKSPNIVDGRNLYDLKKMKKWVLTTCRWDGNFSQHLFSIFEDFSIGTVEISGDIFEGGVFNQSG